MENPYLSLGMKSRITRNEIVKELESRARFLSRLRGDNEYFFKEMIKKNVSFKYVGITRDFMDTGIEDEMAEKFACNIIPKSRYMSHRELNRLYGTIEIEKNSEKEFSTNNYNFYSKVVTSQRQKLNRAYEEYNRVLTDYENTKGTEPARTALYDLYIKMKYEDEVIKIATDIAMKTKRSFDAKKDMTNFKEILLNDKRYKKLRKTYEKVATKRKRDDLDPELYIKSRLGNPSLIKVVDPEWKQHIIQREKDFRSEYLNQIADSNNTSSENLAENQEHDYGWGIVINKPEYVMKDFEVNNSDFQGKISVKHVGFFSSESLFRKRKLLKEKHESTKISKFAVVEDSKRREFTLKIHQPNPDIPKDMREYYYRYDPTKQLFNNIYMVSKTDNDGRTKENVVISPVSKKDFGNKYPEQFLANIYFSDYMLDIAEKNGGFAGNIERDGNGLSISTAYSQDEIASAILYQSGAMGRVTNRAKYQEDRWQEADGKKVDAMLRESFTEREISLDE